MPESFPTQKEENCCEVKDSDGGKHLVILGGGSAAFSAALKAAELNAKATIINDGLPIGGTCVNVGCVPSKTLIRAAEAHHRAQNPNGFSGIVSQSKVVDFKAIIEQKRQLVESLGKAKYIDILKVSPNIHFVQGRGKLLDCNTVLLACKRTFWTLAATSPRMLRTARNMLNQAKMNTNKAVALTMPSSNARGFRC